jgi:hypothetical protein
MGAYRNSYRVLVGKPARNRPLQKPRRKWENNSKFDLLQVGWGGMDRIYLTQGTDQRQELVNTVMNPRVP